MPASQYTITVTPQAFNYIRQVLGTRPHDEVRGLIAQIEQIVAEQDKQQAAAEAGPLQGMPPGLIEALSGIQGNGKLPNGEGATP